MLFFWRVPVQPRDTERLTFRPLTMDDAGFLDALNRAPGVMEFLDWEPPSVADIRATDIPLRLALAEEHPGYGVWLAFHREKGEFVGRFSLRLNSPAAGDAEIGYGMMPAWWGQGLASEAARELLRYAFEDLQVERLVAITMSVNTRSRRVMERIGLSYIRTFHVEFEDPLPGTEHGEVEYAMTRDEWSRH